MRYVSLIYITVEIFWFQLQPTDSSSIKIALNGSIDLKVTPPEEAGNQTIASNTGLVVVPPQMASMPHSHHGSPSSPVSAAGQSASNEQLQGTIV